MNYTKTPPHPFRVSPSPYSLQLSKYHVSTAVGIKGHVTNFSSDKQLGLLGIRHCGPYGEATFIGLLGTASLHGCHSVRTSILLLVISTFIHRHFTTVKENKVTRTGSHSEAAGVGLHWSFNDTISTITVSVWADVIRWCYTYDKIYVYAIYLK